MVDHGRTQAEAARLFNTSAKTVGKSVAASARKALRACATAPHALSSPSKRRLQPAMRSKPCAGNAALKRLARADRARGRRIVCTLRGILLATPFVPMPGQERLIGAIQRAAVGIMDEPVGTKGVPIYTDARLYSAAGIPTVLTAWVRAPSWRPTATAPTKSSS
jgi:hypothetical protein